jgi:hypothetical protein
MTEIGAQRGAGWWPAIVLWGSVIAVGALYLASVEHHRRAARMDDMASAAVRPAVSAPSAAVVNPAVVVPDHSRTQAQAATGAEIGDAERLPISEPEPPGRPSAVSVAPAAVSVPSVAPVVVALPVAAPASAVSAVSAVGATAGAGGAQMPAPVTPAEAMAFAEAVTETSPVAPIRVPPTASAPAAQSAPVPAGAAAATPPGAAERARILAEYEALHRAAQQELAPYWGRRIPHRGYGVPSYAPGPGHSRQAPGYNPGYPGR